MTNKRRLSAIEEKVAARCTRPLGTDEALKTARIWKSLNDRLRKQSAKNYRINLFARAANAYPPENWIPCCEGAREKRQMLHGGLRTRSGMTLLQLRKGAADQATYRRRPYRRR